MANMHDPDDNTRVLPADGNAHPLPDGKLNLAPLSPGGNAHPHPSGGKWLAALSSLLKCLWTFFPSLLFIGLMITSFWLLDQGKDILLAYMEKGDHGGLYSAVRIVLFIAVAFWVYVPWYSSRIIAYIKQQSYRSGNNRFGISKYFLDIFPRMAGNACLLTLELAVLQSPVLNTIPDSRMAFVIFAVLLVALFLLDGKIRADWSRRRGFRTVFTISLTLFLALLMITAFPSGNIMANSLFVLGLLILLHIVYILYINLRRNNLEAQMALRPEQIPAHPNHPHAPNRSILQRIMDYFSIPGAESGYFRYFLGLFFLGTLIDWLAILFLPIARAATPFPMVIIGFTVLLILGNVITAFSVLYRVNIHFIIFVIALGVSLKENHAVSTIPATSQTNLYKQRPDLKTYLQAWLDDRVTLADSAKAPYDIFFVLSNGGASRSGFWTASVLGKLQDSCLFKVDSGSFSRHLFCLSGTSGGGVGMATFFSLLRDNAGSTNKSYRISGGDFLAQDFFTYTEARMLGPDYFHYLFPFGMLKDRGWALGYSLESSAQHPDTGDYRVPFDDPFSAFPALDHGKVVLPLLFVNTTRMQDGNPGVVTNLALDPSLFNNRVDVLSLLDSDRDISLANAAILGARFPYLSPGGRIASQYFVDGGYFDNSGAGVVQELIQGIMNIIQEDKRESGHLFQQLRRLRFHVLHIINSPIEDSTVFKKVPPVKNDLFSPFYAILGAYDMQTTVNDNRLRHFIEDINSFSGQTADYRVISLYKSPGECKKDSLLAKESPYAMNWFMSKILRQRMVDRLAHDSVLRQLIKEYHL